MAMEGFATMYMRMPMSSSTLPIHGRCTVEDQKITLKFPFTGIEFDLPSSRKEGRNDFDFKVNFKEIYNLCFIPLFLFRHRWS